VDAKAARKKSLQNALGLSWFAQVVDGAAPYRFDRRAHASISRAHHGARADSSTEHRRPDRRRRSRIRICARRSSLQFADTWPSIAPCVRGAARAIIVGKPPMKPKMGAAARASA